MYSHSKKWVSDDMKEKEAKRALNKARNKLCPKSFAWTHNFDIATHRIEINKWYAEQAERKEQNELIARARAELKDKFPDKQVVLRSTIRTHELLEGSVPDMPSTGSQGPIMPISPPSSITSTVASQQNLRPVASATPPNPQPRPAAQGNTTRRGGSTSRPNNPPRILQRGQPLPGAPQQNSQQATSRNFGRLNSIQEEPSAGKTPPSNGTITPPFVAHTFRRAMSGKEIISDGQFRTNHSAVLAAPTIFSTAYGKDGDMPDWPSKDEMKYDGDSRVETDRRHQRFPPAPRVPGPKNSWQDRCFIIPFNLDDVRADLSSVGILMKAHYIPDVITEEEGSELIDKELMEMLNA